MYMQLEVKIKRYYHSSTQFTGQTYGYFLILMLFLLSPSECHYQLYSGMHFVLVSQAFQLLLQIEPKVASCSQNPAQEQGASPVHYVHTTCMHMLCVIWYILKIAFDMVIAM